MPPKLASQSKLRPELRLAPRRNAGNCSRLARLTRRLAFLVFLFGAWISVGAFEATLARATVSLQPLTQLFATPLTSSAIDSAATAEWVDGAERPFANPIALRQMFWTQTAPSGDSILAFGASTQPGIRHLRIGFTSPLRIGSILVRGGGQLSVLRPGAAYPGNLGDESAWLPAQRIVIQRSSSQNSLQVSSQTLSQTSSHISSDPVDKNSYALWVLPPGISTRALRFTHIAGPADATYAGALGGVYLLPSRFANLAPQAAIAVSANGKSANLLTDEQFNSWLAWDNGPTYPHLVTKTTPESITLLWQKPVALSGLAALWAGFDAAEVQIFSGPENVNPQDAPDSDWHDAGAEWSLRNQYPRALGIDWYDFGKTITTRAVRLKITQVADENHHPHLAGKTQGGHRVWLGELMALSPLAGSELQAAIFPAASDTGPKPPVPVRFTLDAPGYVTLVIEDANGNRVRNLISDTWFQAGPNTVWWDGTDDLERNPDAAAHGVYLIPTHFVAPGKYFVRGLVHQAIHLRYEFSVYNPGNPPWETVDTKGGWLTNHTPPSSALFLPADKALGGKPLVYLGSYVSEGGAGLAWVDLQGRKQGGRGWIGGTWTAAPYLARDSGSQANTNIYAYVGAAWSETVSGDAESAAAAKHLACVIRLTALTPRGDKPILKYDFDPGASLDHDANGKPLWTNQIGGLAVHNNLIAVSLSRIGQVLFADATSGKALGLAPVNDPRGIAFDAQGRMLVLSGLCLLRYPAMPATAQFNPRQLPNPEVLIADGLEDPTGLTVDADGGIYIGDRGKSHQIKVFSAAGKFLRAIGHPGAPQAGPYDPMHINNPRGLAIDSNHHLWVAEEDFQPKRVSVWTLDGQLVNAFYGPAEYGGGGTIDPVDKTRFYYHGMEFKLDWQTGSSTLASILYRPGKDDIQLPYTAYPSTAIYSHGHRYFTNTYLGYSTNGVSIGVLYLDRGGILKAVAALGRANDWDVLKADRFKPYLPPGADLENRYPDHSVLFAWSDTNQNGQVDPEEVTFLKAYTGEITIMPDPAKPDPAQPSLAMYDSVVDGKAMRYAPIRVTPAGIPVYDLHRGEVLADGAQRPSSDGGGQLLYSPQATVLTTAPLPFAPQGVGGVTAQGHRWSYPSLWPGLHASHSAPVPDTPGELIGTTRLLGSFISPAGANTGLLWGINGNSGDMYLFTADGLFVTQLFQDVRKGNPWSMPIATRNMLVNDVSLHDENFFPTLEQTADGNIYVIDGSRTSIVRVDGLNTLRSLPTTPLEVAAADLQKAQTFLRQREAARQDKSGKQTLIVTLRAVSPSSALPALKDLAAMLKNASWATIDSRITKVGWGEKPDVVEAAIAIAGNRLFAAFKSSDPNLLANSGAVANAPFKTGGALDLMIGADPNADPQRQHPVVGDLRLLVYMVDNRPRATLYRAIVPGATNPIAFTSPLRTITLDQVEDVSDSLEFDSANGSYAFSIPLAKLGLKPIAGQTIKADIGILRGNGAQTTQRVYWSNKATGITADVPSEAELTPNLWGEWVFKPAP